MSLQPDNASKYCILLLNINSYIKYILFSNYLHFYFINKIYFHWFSDLTLFKCCSLSCMIVHDKTSPTASVAKNSHLLTTSVCDTLLAFKNHIFKKMVGHVHTFTKAGVKPNYQVLMLQFHFISHVGS